MPSFAGVTAKRDDVPQIRRSHATATWVPPPIANPSIAATVGLVQSMIARSPAATASP